jgi:hypothetical protein
MARMSQAPILILTAPNAAAPRVPMVVRATAAQRERGCSSRQAGEKNHDSEKRHRNLFHSKSPVALNRIAQRFQSYGREVEALLNRKFQFFAPTATLPMGPGVAEAAGASLTGRGSMARSAKRSDRRAPAC